MFEAVEGGADMTISFQFFLRIVGSNGLVPNAGGNIPYLCNVGKEIYRLAVRRNLPVIYGIVRLERETTTGGNRKDKGR